MLTSAVGQLSNTEKLERLGSLGAFMKQVTQHEIENVALEYLLVVLVVTSQWQYMQMVSRQND